MPEADSVCCEGVLTRVLIHDSWKASDKYHLSTSLLGKLLEL